MVYASVAVAHENSGINQFMSPPWSPNLLIQDMPLNLGGVGR